MEKNLQIKAVFLIKKKKQNPLFDYTVRIEAGKDGEWKAKEGTQSRQTASVGQ